MTIKNTIIIKQGLKPALLIIYFFIHAFQSVNASQNKPNFLWLVSEDNAHIFSALYNKQGAKMPNVEALAQNGLIFNHAFSNAPVCSTARSTLATGAYAPKLGLNYHRRYSKSQLPDDLLTVSQMLSNIGYYTSNNAKNDFNFKTAKQAPVWDESSNKASWRARQPGQPFFHMQTWSTTHEYQLHFPASAVNKKPTKHNPDNIKLPPIYPDTELFRYTYARYLDQHQLLDQQIGQLIAQLKADGELENTFIFYFGDHGGVTPGTKGYINDLGLHVPLVIRIPKNFKHLLHPQMQNLKKTRIDGFVNFVDFAPTLLKLAGSDTSKHQDGKAFLGKDISLTELNQRQSSFAYADRFDEKSDMARSLRIGKYKYVRYFQPFIPNALFNDYRYKQAAYQEWKTLYQQGKLNSVQAAFFKPKPAEALYNLEADPFETNNLADKAKFQPKLNELRSRLTEQLKDMPDLAFYPEYWLELNAFEQPIQFGIDHQTQIGRLIDIANTQLKPWAQAKTELLTAIHSSNRFERYWALISLSYFSSQAQQAINPVKALLKAENDPVIKARAIEFLTLASNYNPSEQLTHIIKNTSNTLQVIEIMNIATLLHDRKGIAFDFPDKPYWNKNASSYQQKTVNYWTQKRVKYLKH